MPSKTVVLCTVALTQELLGDATPRLKRSAPDYARTVDIHRKPGYDPVELFLDPAIRVPPLAIGSRVVRKKLGFRAREAAAR